MKSNNRIVTIIVIIGMLLGAFFTYSYLREKKRKSRFELLTILGNLYMKQRDSKGRWRVQGAGKPLRNLDEKEIERLSKLSTLPYLQGYKTAPARKNVTVYDSSRAYNGLNLYCSGHAPEAFVMDMRGDVLHKWRFEIGDIWPKVPKTVHSTFWRRVYWYPNGDILAIFEGTGIIKLDKDSNLLWAYRGGCHHQAYVTPDGRIFVLTRHAEIAEDINPEEPVLIDEITILSPEGKVLRKVPIIDCFRKSRFKRVLDGMKDKGDIFHTNSVYVIGKGMQRYSPHFKPGNVLLSILELNTIAILDLNSGSVVWAESGKGDYLWRAQHDAKLLKNGNMLLFDNCGFNGKSRALEYNIARRRIIWQYTGSDSVQLFSRTCGISQRLPNGNTLITESDNGRAIEVTPGKEIVWEFYNPHRAGERKELIATLFEVKRVDKEYFQWLRTGKE